MINIIFFYTGDIKLKIAWLFDFPCKDDNKGASNNLLSRFVTKHDISGFL